MTSRIRLVLVLTAMILALSLVGGTAGHQAVSTTSHSPYVSALVDVSVATAEAASHKRCQNRSCGSLQGIPSCTEDTFGTNCALANGICTATPCP